MNGPHDMGGMQCYGAVEPEADEPIFHGEWEKKAMAMTVAMGFTGEWNIDISRFERESLPPDFYLTKSYYQIWLAGLQNLMVKRGMVSADELASGRKIEPAKAVKRVVAAQDVPAVLAKGGPVEREASSKPEFSVGDRVQTLVINPKGHTRLPRYARGKIGTVMIVHGCHVFPDTNAKGEGEYPQWLYSISFDAQSLFGTDAEVGNVVNVDCWEPYLDRA